MASGLSVPSLADWTAVLESPCLFAWAQYVASEAAGLGGIRAPEDAEEQVADGQRWGRIPGPPDSSERSLVGASEMSAASAASTGSTPLSTVSGLHHQISMRLGKMSGHMFRLGLRTNAAAMAASTTSTSAGLSSSFDVNPSAGHQTAVSTPNTSQATAVASPVVNGRTVFRSSVSSASGWCEAEEIREVNRGHL